MKLTKYEHACLELESNGKRLIVDPGMYCRPLDDKHDVAAIVITHQHDDHCWEEQLDRILALNPQAAILAPSDVCERLAGYQTTAVYHGDHYEFGGFTIDFFGDLHEVIHRSIPVIQNRGVLINNKLYYPGDSYTLPDLTVEYLAVPTSAPWLRIAEVIDFVAAIKPKHAFATHNIHLSEQGHALNNSRVQATAEANGGDFRFLQPGESWMLD
ncbi:MAG: hypothetical protein RL670_1073 [Actinomycetota bacterium]|jgi:L-ascorbate metabolism protein UlaG (beta-lactamase superfamily)